MSLLVPRYRLWFWLLLKNKGAVMNAVEKSKIQIAVKAIGLFVAGYVDGKVLLSDGSFLSYNKEAADRIGKALGMSITYDHRPDNRILVCFSFDVDVKINTFCDFVDSESSVEDVGQFLLDKVFDCAERIGLQVDADEKIKAFHGIEKLVGVGNESLSPSSTLDAVKNVVMLAARLSILCDNHTLLSKLSADDVLLVQMRSDEINKIGHDVLAQLSKCLPSNSYALVFSDHFKISTLPTDDMERLGWVRSTVAARWRSEGKPDPHGNVYNIERGALSLGHLTDDELANAVFVLDHRTSLESIVYLNAAKERIRWLSRQLSAAAPPSFDDVIVWHGAFNYYLGRSTTAVSAFVDDLIANWQKISHSARALIERDLNKAFLDDDEHREKGYQNKRLGHDCDRASWQKVKDLWSEL